MEQDALGQLDGMTSRQEEGGLFNVLLEII